MNHVAVITGTGLVTPLGASANQTWDALLAGKFISDHTRVPNIDTPDRAIALAEMAGGEAIAQAGWSRETISDPSTALIIATSKGPIETWLATQPILAVEGIGQIASSVAGKFSFDAGPRLTLSAACASGLHGLIRATMMIKSGEIRRALVIALEASLHPLFIATFARLGVLPPAGFGCRPFDRDRQGFVLSEAAAAVCVESIGATSSPVLAKIDRFGLGGDATHLTGSDPDARTLRYLLERVVDKNRVDLIHAHGTGTILNDPAELEMLESQFNSQGPVTTYSHKAALGHSLGASGLVSIVLNCLAIRSSRVPGNIRTQTPLPTKSLAIDHNPREHEVHRSLAIAAGFGGPVAVVGLIK